MADAPAFFRMFPGRAEPFSALPEPPLDDEQEQQLLDGRWVPGGPLVARRNSDAREPGSLSYGGSPLVRLLGPQLVGALRDGGCTGWSTYPVVVLDEDGTALAELAGLSVSGRCGPTACGPPVEGQPEWRRGIVVDPATWDGSDVFLPDGAGGPFFSERVRSAVAAAGIRDVDFEPLHAAEVWVGSRG